MTEFHVNSALLKSEAIQMKEKKGKKPFALFLLTFVFNSYAWPGMGN